MPVYETESELRAAEAAYRQARLKEMACKATGLPCICVGIHHVEAKHRRGLHVRAANGLFSSGTRTVMIWGCRWCGLTETRHCGGAPTPRGLHTWEHPTLAQLRARKAAAAGLAPDADVPRPVLSAPVESECRCDRGDEDAEPCGADDCVIDELLELGFPG
jgi:hypothetical protein